MTIAAENLHVIRCYDRLPPLPGGMERHIAELTAAQRRIGVRVTEIHNSGEPAGEARRVWPWLRTDRLRPSLLRWSLFYFGAALGGVDRSDGRVPIVHVHGDLHAFELAALLSKRVRAKALAASLHGRFHAPVARYARALRNCDPIFTTGLAQAAELRQVLQREVIHLPSAPADLFYGSPASTSEPVDVIAVGSLLPVKNLDLLLDCAALRPLWRFSILGEGPERPRLERLKNERGLSNVMFRGAVTPEDVHSALCSARLLLNTSWSEGSPTAALEAMACGVPVVLTPGNDYSSVVQTNVNGIVSGGWTAGELVEAMSHFLEHEENLARAGRSARATALEHRWDRKGRLVTEAIMSAVERSKDTSR
ncbi:MAG TPA: glycosyltransferase family 4 protein [Sphingomicrobium sp.]|nr:glycosyltransferase family 4 protein [Sphingomicrobium sp.]